MDKNAIKKYAVWARTELITRVSQRAEKYDITAEADENASSVNGVLLSDAEKKQRKALIEQVKQKGFDQVMEEVAYTWFNRFIALRFMEVNGYLPSHIRVFTDDNNNFKPQILAEAIHLELDGLDMEKVYEMKNNNENDELYKYLIIVQCNNLSKILPGMFQKIADYTELLFIDNVLREGSVIEQLVILVPEDDWKDQVQIVGWLYQYYNSEPKDQVFAALKKNVKIAKENIPAATQLFTPDWIVRYMVENSLGRIWKDGHSDSAIEENWKYYFEESEQSATVQERIDSIHKGCAALHPENILCIDPCSGSGHILAYMFDVLIQIYEDYGISTRDAVKSIVLNNIWGLDIDDRAAQLAYFSVMMKGVQYDRRFLQRKDENGNPAVPQPHVYSICESNNIDSNAIDYFCNGDNELIKDINIVLSGLNDAKEYGSILRLSPINYEKIYARFNNIEEDISVYKDVVKDTLLPLVHVFQALEQKYHVAVTNPPYMGSRKSMNPRLKKYVEKNYPDSKSDLYSVFIERCLDFAKSGFYAALISQQSFMFTDDYKELRSKIVLNNHFVNMIHLGADAFPEINGEVVQTTTFVLNSGVSDSEYMAKFSRMVDFSCDDKPVHVFDADYNYLCSSSQFEGIKATPFSYWLSEKMRESFDIGEPFEEYGNPRAGITTGENDRFLRYWFEVAYEKIGDNYPSVDEFHKSGKLYIPYNKGGKQIRWYGNNDYVLKFDKNNYDILSNQGNHLPSRQYYCLKCITWSDISGRSFAARYCKQGSIFDVKGSCGFPLENNYWLSLAFLNSKLTPLYIDSLNPTTTTQVGDLKRIPIIAPTPEVHKRIDVLAQECVEITKYMYDAYETSRDFKCNPLVTIAKRLGNNCLIKDAFDIWEKDASEKLIQLKKNEEELNSIFIDLYGLTSEVDAVVDDKDITLNRAELKTDIKALLSYAVGCLFGRYSLDNDGIINAGDSFDASLYKAFPADKDNIIPISDDEYFADDIVAQVIRFISITFGNINIEENVSFISSVLGGKGTARENIRNYFLNDFYTDHLRTYQKAPIYWLFESGKKNGFKCLIYMLRYQPDTVARIRTDYVHELQSRYRTAISDLEQRLNNATGADKVKISKKLNLIKEQSDEIHSYEEKIHHIADQMISIDFDDGDKCNYSKFKDVLAKI